MRVGVVGCGYWGSRHLRVLHQISDVDHVVVVDQRPAAQLLAAQAFPGTQLFNRLAEAIPHVDALVIATPAGTHETLALEAMRAGKHVLIEKPMATSTEGAVRLIDQAAQSSVTLMVGHTFIYSDAVTKLQEIVGSGDLGSLQHIDTARLNLGIYQRDVNVVWDLAPHDVSIINHLVGRLPTSVQAWGSCHVDPTVEDVAYLRLIYADSDATAVISASWLSPCKVRRVTVVGSRKMAVYDDMAEQEPVRLYDKGVTRPDPLGDFPEMPMSYRYGDIVSPYVQIREPLMQEDAHFLDCIRLRRQPKTDGLSGFGVIMVLEAASLALRTRAEVSLESMRAARLPERRWHESLQLAAGAR